MRSSGLQAGRGPRRLRSPALLSSPVRSDARLTQRRPEACSAESPGPRGPAARTQEMRAAFPAEFGAGGGDVAVPGTQQPREGHRTPPSTPTLSSPARPQPRPLLGRRSMCRRPRGSGRTRTEGPRTPVTLGMVGAAGTGAGMGTPHARGQIASCPPPGQARASGPLAAAGPPLQGARCFVPSGRHWAAGLRVPEGEEQQGGRRGGSSGAP